MAVLDLREKRSIENSEMSMFPTDWSFPDSSERVSLGPGLSPGCYRPRSTTVGRPPPSATGRGPVPGTWLGLSLLFSESRGTLAEAAIPAGPAEPDRLAPFDRRVLVVAATVFVVLMALSGLYGFHRDELYFLDCARHLQGGYVDQPILTPLLARLSLSLLGVWLPGLRFWAALSAAATVVTGGLLARELGGGRHAQLVAAVATAAMPAVLGGGHLMGPTTFDILAWAAVSSWSCGSGARRIRVCGCWLA